MSKTVIHLACTSSQQRILHLFSLHEWCIHLLSLAARKHAVQPTCLLGLYLQNTHQHTAANGPYPVRTYCRRVPWHMCMWIWVQTCIPCIWYMSTSSVLYTVETCQGAPLYQSSQHNSCELQLVLPATCLWCVCEADEATQMGRYLQTCQRHLAGAEESIAFRCVHVHGRTAACRRVSCDAWEVKACVMSKFYHSQLLRAAVTAGGSRDCSCP